MKSVVKTIGFIVLLLLPLSARGQQVGRWGDGKLREAALAVSSNLPFATVVYDFAERYLISLQGMTEEEQRSRMERDDVRVMQGDLTRLSLINGQTSLSFAEKDEYYQMGLFNGDFPLMELVFPASCQLLLGKNLKALEQEWIAELDTFSYKPNGDTEICKEELRQVSKGFFVYDGSSYYLESIHNHQYFQERNDSLKKVFTMDHPAESVSNLFVSESVDNKLSLCLTIRKYGLKKEQKEVPINQWIAYQKSKGCDIFVGIEELRTDRIQAMVFVVNPVLKYNHVMNVEVPYDLLVKGEGCVEGDINLFIPTHNIKSLFDELNVQNKKDKRQIKVK